MVSKLGPLLFFCLLENHKISSWPSTQLMKKLSTPVCMCGCGYGYLCMHWFVCMCVWCCSTALCMCVCGYVYMCMCCFVCMCVCVIACMCVRCVCVCVCWKFS